MKIYPLLAAFLLSMAFSFVMFNKYGERAVVKSNKVHLDLLAVDSTGKGVVVGMDVYVREGNGKILVNIDNPSFILDVQQSMRDAVNYAFEYTGLNKENYDVIFSFQTNASVVGGPSAGAAMAIALIAALEDWKLRNDTVITGALADGKIVPVGGILEKAEAAKEKGYKRLLVPMGEKYVKVPVENCTERWQGNVYRKECVINYVEKDVAKEVGIDVLEVRSVDEAIRYAVIK